MPLQVAPGQQQFQPGQILITRDGRKVEFVRYDELGNAVVRPVTAQGPDGTQDQEQGQDQGPDRNLSKDFYSAERLGRDVGILGRTAAQGATFGFSDELRGLVGAAFKGDDEAETFGERYRASRDTEREALAQAREDAPILSLLGEVGGGVATGFGAAGGLRALGSRAGGLLARGASKVVGRPAMQGVGSKLLTPAARQAPARGAGVRAQVAHRAGQAKDVLTGARGPAGGVEAAKAARIAEAGGKGGGVGSRIWSGMKVGAAEGGLYGAGMGGGERNLTLGESLKSRLGTGAGGATLGFAGAGLLGAGAAGAGRLGRFTKEAIGSKGPVKVQATADEAIIKSLMEADPQKFLIGGRGWVRDINRAIEAPTPENLKKVALADKKAAQEALRAYQDAAESEIFAGARNAHREAVIRESQPGAVSGLLADANEDLSRTAAQAATMVGKQPGALKQAVRARANPVASTMDEMQRASQTPKSPGSAKDRLMRLEDDRAKQAARDYKDFYTGSSTEEAATLSSPELHTFMDRLRLAGKRDKRVLLELRGAASSTEMMRAIDAPALGGGVRLDRTLDQILKKPPVKGPRAGKVDASMKDLDLLRRTIKGVERKLKTAKPPDEAWKSFRGLADELDDAIGKHTPKYRKTRKKYEVESRGIDAYEDGTRPFSRAEDLKAAYDNAHKSIAYAGTKNPKFTKGQVKKIKANFRQGRLDAVADEANKRLRTDPHGASAIKYLEDQFAMMFDPPNGAFMDLMSPDEILKARRNLEQRFRQAQTTQAVASASPAGRVKEAGSVEGSTEAMAGLYLGAGQAGAAGRTLVQSFMYSDASKKAIASALSRRLRQKESTGLLRAAGSLGKTELKRLRGLLYQKGAAQGGAMGAASMREAFTGDTRYGGYRPMESRQRSLLQQRMREEDERLAAESRGQ